jgi:RNA processing factor Prp31
MKAIIVQFPFGVVAFGPENKIAGKVVFPKRPQAAAKTVAKINEGKLTADLERLITSLQSEGYDTFVFDNPELADSAKRRLNIPAETISPHDAEEMRSRGQQLAIEIGFAKDAAELAQWTRNVTMELAKIQVKGKAQKRDLIVAQARSRPTSLVARVSGGAPRSPPATPRRGRPATARTH